MARLVLVLDMENAPLLWDPHEVIEDVLAHAEDLPTFTQGMSWFLKDIGGMEAQAGTFCSAEWQQDDVVEAVMQVLRRQESRYSIDWTEAERITYADAKHKSLQERGEAVTRQRAIEILTIAGVLPKDPDE